jgi:hypothetical protein
MLLPRRRWIFLGSFRERSASSSSRNRRPRRLPTAYVPYQEINPSGDDELECIVVRSGQASVIVNPRHRAGREAG